jgi:predicted nucleic acid-binding Zn ribbon protein
MKKKLEDRECVYCGKTFTPKAKNSVACSDECKKEYTKILVKRKRSKELIENGVENVDYVIDRWNGLATERIYGWWMKKMHPGKTIDDYRKEFPDAPITSEKDLYNTTKNGGLHMKEEKYKKMFSEKFKGENNPRHHSKVSKQEIRENSPFCKEFYEKRGLTEDDRKQFIARAEADRNIDTRLDYYLKLGMELSQAREALFERQRTFTLDKCIEKYGEVEGRRRWSERQEKWAKIMKIKYENGEYDKTPHNLLDSLSSQIEQEFVTKLHNEMGLDINESYNSLSSKYQYGIYSHDHKKRFVYDFVYGNKIIEFNGDFWHANPNKYDADDYIRNGKFAKDVWEKDEIKKKVAESEDFELFVVWESEFKKCPEETIRKCIDFINGIKTNN